MEHSNQPLVMREHSMRTRMQPRLVISQCRTCPEFESRYQETPRRVQPAQQLSLVPVDGKQ